MSKERRGRHQSSCKDGKKTISFLEAQTGVNGVIIGRSFGGKAIRANAKPGQIKLQREEESGFKAVLQTSKGIQEIFILVDKQNREDLKKAINSNFS